MKRNKTYTIQGETKRYIKLGWSPHKAQELADLMIRSMKSQNSYVHMDKPIWKVKD